MKSVVFDPGHCSFRAGFAGDDKPTLDVPSYVGYVEDTNSDKTTNKKVPIRTTKNYFIGRENLSGLIDGMEMGSVIREGIIEDFQMFEAIVSYCYSGLQCKSDEHRVLLSREPWTTRLTTELITEVMFEKFDIPSISFVKTPVMVATAHGKTSCLIVDSGSTHTSVIPVIDGYCVSEGIKRTPLGGCVIDDLCKSYLDKNLLTSPDSSMKFWERPSLDNTRFVPAQSKMSVSYREFQYSEQLKFLKADVLKVSGIPIDKNFRNYSTIKLSLPGCFQSIWGMERYQIPEQLFNPKQLSLRNHIMGASELVHRCIESCDFNQANTLLDNIIVTGGNSLISGFVERLAYDLYILNQKKLDSAIFSSSCQSHRIYSAWLGGSILASLKSYEPLWTSKQEYKERGHSAVLSKCH